MAHDFQIIDGFDDYATSSEALSGSAWPISNNDGLTLVTGRNGYRKALYNLGKSYLGRATGGVTQIQGGAAFKFDILDPAYYLFCARTLASNTGNNEGWAGLWINSAGQLAFARGAPLSTHYVYGASEESVGVGTWNYIEFWMEYGNPGGFKAWLNGKLVVDLDDVDTTPFVDTYLMPDPGYTPLAPVYSVVHVGGSPLMPSSFGVAWDDVYIDAPSEPLPLGDSRVYIFEPTGTDHNDFTVTGASAEAALSDFDDATFVTKDVVGAEVRLLTTDSFATVPSDIYAVAIQSRAKKSDTGTRALQGVIGTAAGYVHSGDEVFLSQSYQPAQWTYTVNPETNALWTADDFDDLVFGVRIST